MDSEVIKQSGDFIAKSGIWGVNEFIVFFIFMFFLLVIVLIYVTQNNNKEIIKITKDVYCVMSDLKEAIKDCLEALKNK